MSVLILRKFASATFTSTSSHSVISSRFLGNPLAPTASLPVTIAPQGIPVTATLTFTVVRSLPSTLDVVFGSDFLAAFLFSGVRQPEQYLNEPTTSGLFHPASHHPPSRTLPEHALPPHRTTSAPARTAPSRPTSSCSTHTGSEALAQQSKDHRDQFKDQYPMPNNIPLPEFVQGSSRSVAATDALPTMPIRLTLSSA